MPSSHRPSPRAPGHLHVISVDDGACDVGQQANELLLKATHTVWDLVDDYLNALVIPQDVDANDGRIVVTGQVSGHDVYHKVARAVGHEEVKGTQDAVHTPCQRVQGCIAQRPHTLVRNPAPTTSLGEVMVLYVHAP